MSNDLTVYEPTNLEQAMSLANTLSKSNLVPKAFAGRPADVLLVMMAGKELGFSTVQSFRSFYVLNGKVSLYADAMVGVCVGKPQCKYFRLLQSDETSATYCTLRDGSEPVTMTYTLEQAKKAGLTSNATYQKHGAAMLRARCASALARVVYPDMLAGIYDPSELEEPDPAPRPTLHVEVDPEERTAVVPGDVAPPAPVPTAAESSFRVEPEWDDNSKEHKQATAEHATKTAKFTSGPLRDQYMEAASLVDLVMYREKLQKIIDGGRKTMPNLMALAAMDYWIEKKQPPDDDYTDAEREAPAPEPTA